MKLEQTLLLTEERIRAYSRRGNFHSDAAEATSLGLPGLVAQGVQVAGPAYGVLLDAWAEDFLAHGELTCTFVGMVTDDDQITARVELDPGGEAATFEVRNDTTGKTAVVGQARRSVPSGPG